MEKKQVVGTQPGGASLEARRKESGEGCVDTDALACRRVSAAKSLKSRGGAFISMYRQARARVIVHVSCTSDSWCLGRVCMCEGNSTWANIKGGGR